MRRLPARDLALVATGTALVAALGVPGQLPLALPALGGVPITLQSLGVMLVGAVLGARRGAAAVVVLLVLVAAGLPLLAGGRGGLGAFFQPSAGYLAGWVLGAAVVGAVAARRPRRAGPFGWGLLACLLGGVVVVYAVGVPVVAARTAVPLGAAALASLAYLPGDLLKAVVAAAVAAGVARGYPVLDPAPARQRAAARR